MNRRRWIGCVVLAVVLGSVGVSTQGPFNAQIQAFYRFLQTAPQTMSGVWTFQNLTVNGTCTGCGGGGGTPGGSNTQVQFNNSNAFGGSANLTWDGTVFTNLKTEFVGPTESSLPPTLQGYIGGATILTTALGATSLPALGIESASSAGASNTIGFYAVTLGQEAFQGVIGQQLDTLSSGANSTLYSQYLSPNLLAGSDGSSVYGSYVFITANGTAGDSAYANYVKDFSLFNGATFTSAYAFYAHALAGGATNVYSFWSDEQGVFRIKADNTFNSVYQAIPALYNPQVTKYTPGAANYERIVLGQWDGNVAEIGTENGGMGTLRSVKLIGGGLQFASGLVAPAMSGTRFLCISTAGVVTSSATACVGT